MSLRILKVLVLFACVAAFGCGEHPHVLEGDKGAPAGGPGVNSAEVKPAGNGEPVAQVQDEDPIDGGDTDPTDGNPGPVGPTGPSGTGNGNDGSGTPGPTGPQGPQGKDGIDGQSTTPVVIVGPKGEDGKNGKDGISTCKTDQIFDSTFPLLQASADEIINPKYELPLISTSAAGHKIARLPLGGANNGANQSKKQRRANAKIAPTYVQDTMVFLKTKLSLPAQRFAKVKHVIFTFIAEKISVDMNTHSEFIALLDEQILSGSRYTAPRWLQNNNPNFKDAVNSNFSARVQEGILASTSGNLQQEGTYPFTITVTLDEIVAGSKFADGHAYLYRNASSLDEQVEVTIPMVIADDTRILNGSVAVKYEEDTCQSGKLIPAAAVSN